MKISKFIMIFSFGLLASCLKTRLEVSSDHVKMCKRVCGYTKFRAAGIDWFNSDLTCVCEGPYGGKEIKRFESNYVCADDDDDCDD